MQIDRDELVVTYDPAKANKNALTTVIREAGYSSFVVRSEGKPAAVAVDPGLSNDPLLTAVLAVEIVGGYLSRDSFLMALIVRLTWSILSLRKMLVRACLFGRASTVRRSSSKLSYWRSIASLEARRSSSILREDDPGSALSLSSDIVS